MIDFVTYVDCRFSKFQSSRSFIYTDYMYELVVQIFI